LPYDNLITRTDAGSLIPEEVSTDMLNNMRERAESAALALFRRIPVSRGQVRFPVLSALPIAYWVTGDTGLKQTTEANWANKFLNVEEIACIVPVPQNVLDDTDIDLWGEIQPDIEEAVGRTLDASVFFGINAPATFPDDVVTAAVAAGNVYARGTNNAAAGGISEDLNQLLGLVEADGFVPSGAAANPLFKKFVRGARDSQGRAQGDITVNDFWGADVSYPMPGLWPTGVSAAEVIMGAFGTQFVIGVRKDITLDVSTEAVIQDNTGAIIYNLFQQDMAALRVTFRAGWQVANTINNQQAVEANRYPAAVLRSPAA
jgi:HK97 family phage major capsid protein